MFPYIIKVIQTEISMTRYVSVTEIIIARYALLLQ